MLKKKHILNVIYCNTVILDYFNRFFRFNLDLTVIKGELKSGLIGFLKESPQYCASIIGTRQSDTSSRKLQYFQVK